MKKYNLEPKTFNASGHIKRSFLELQREIKNFDALNRDPAGKYTDKVNHPTHYTQGIECIDYVESHKMDFCQGNAIKYITRFRHKNGIEDLNKARWYVDRLIEQESKKCIK